MPSSSTSNSKKEIRYDRQLRLWGDLGQQRLERAHICLLGATATGAEILKSLVLPGIGCFTIVDDAEVTENDIDVNFFVDRSKIGSKRAQIVRDFLLELNSEVKGIVMLKNSNDFIESDDAKQLLKQYNVVIATNLTDKAALDISEFLWKHRIPFVSCKCYGLIAKLRLVLAEHHVIETHPDYLPPSFHLDNPPAELQAFVNSLDLTTLSHEKHSHMPYIVLLAKVLEKWKSDPKNAGKSFPATYSEKSDIKKLLLSMRMPDEKGNLEEENFQEAVNHAAMALNICNVTSSCSKLLNDPRTSDLTADSHRFWIMCKALKRFVEENGQKLPLRGDLPDMISDSDIYVRLQNIYHTEAERQARKIHQYATELCQQLSIDSETTISFDETRLFCKNAAFLRVVETRTISDEFDTTTTKKSNKLQEIWRDLSEGDDADKRFFEWYILLRASERFYAEKERYPGTNGIPEYLDKNDLTCRVRSLLKDYDLPQDIIDEDIVAEMCRYGAAETHVIASFMGGVAAHEVIKLVTKQYVPLNNTFMYDGNRGDGRMFEF